MTEYGGDTTMIKRVNVLGVGVSAINIPTAVETIDQWITLRDPHYVCVSGVHGVMESQHDEQLRHIHNNAGLVTPDGMPLVWLARLAGQPQVTRVYGPDLMLAVCEQGVKRSYRHYLYGGSQEAVQLLASNLQNRFPGINIVGRYSPPFRSLTDEEDAQIVDMINRTNPDIVWVGLSTPKQERWMAAHDGRLHAPALIGVGAAFDFHAGLKPQAPHWMQRSGLEWLFRLVTEPKRLWRRYLSNNPRFVGLVLAQISGWKQFSVD